jgi:polyisoprenoid-binding protein YceI
MKKNLLIGALAIVLIGGYFIMTSGGASTPSATTEETPGARVVPGNGMYAVIPAESSVGWAGKKPLIEGYINAGSIAVTEGTIEVAGTRATGSFTIDMDTLSVSSTPTKPGQESALEGHLKGERWFNIAGFPTATFVIKSVAERPDSATSFKYDVTGSLTMKGKTNDISFPATIYQDEAGKLHARAETEIDRTKWDITAGSASFFDNLADNVIDDMVALSFHVVATQK